MNVYLDIDGVLLTKDLQPAPYLKEFLKYVTDNYPTYWLTSHCKGDAMHTVNFLSMYLDPEIIDILKKVKPTNWPSQKTDAIDFNTPFLWFDDYLFDFEKQVLIEHNTLKSWVKVDLITNPNQLKDLVYQPC